MVDRGAQGDQPSSTFEDDIIPSDLEDELEPKLLNYVIDALTEALDAGFGISEEAIAGRVFDEVINDPETDHIIDIASEVQRTMDYVLGNGIVAGKLQEYLDELPSGQIEQGQGESVDIQPDYLFGEADLPDSTTDYEEYDD